MLDTPLPEINEIFHVCAYTVGGDPEKHYRRYIAGQVLSFLRGELKTLF